MVVQWTTGLADTVLAETTILADKSYEKTTVLEENEPVLFTGLEDTTALKDKKGLTVFSAKPVVHCTAFVFNLFTKTRKKSFVRAYKFKKVSEVWLEWHNSG